MINRQHTANRKPKPRSKDRAIIITSSEGSPSKGGKYNKERSLKKTNRIHLTILLFFCACFLYIMLFLVMGLRSPAEVHTENRLQEEMKFPDGWEEYSYNDIRDHFHCKARSKDNEKSLPSMEDWHLMRKTFTEVVDNKKQWDDPVPPTLGYSLNKGIPAPPPYYPEASPGKGRGLFASRDIKKGELVHDGTHSDVIFPDAIAWRRFVFSLPREMACDSTDWHWMQKLKEGGKYFMLAGLNISSLMNSGGKEFGPGRLPNALPESSTSGKFYATRDIEKSEEILTDYDMYYTNWKEVGL
mmetsp:Transcript_5380/g.9207  ORF Transcript_5380/g.9207 Transcript_5380/m.9207 type:complete len:299 (+) Transcript_5380:56-952(+)